LSMRERKKRGEREKEKEVSKHLYDAKESGFHMAVQTAREERGGKEKEKKKIGYF